MDSLRFEFNVKEFEGKLDELDKLVTDSIMRALVITGEDLRNDAVAIVPFRMGFNGGLAGSASTEQPIEEDGGKMLSVTVGFNKPYAAKMHEDMSLSISQRFAGAQPRQQKYLEKPARENADKYGRILRDAVSDSLS